MLMDFCLVIDVAFTESWNLALMGMAMATAAAATRKCLCLWS
jgi:hypothetical protein